LSGSATVPAGGQFIFLSNPKFAADPFIAPGLGCLINGFMLYGGTNLVRLKPDHVEDA